MVHGKVLTAEIAEYADRSVQFAILKPLVTFSAASAVKSFEIT